MNSHTADINQYCKDVAKGSVLSCEFVKLACKRHTDDLKRQKDADFPYYFDESAITHFLDFAETQIHVKGEWRGQTIKAEPWQKFTFGIPFGWKRKKDDLRRYRRIYVEVARKNAKSTWGAIIGNYMLLADGEGAPEVYSGATSERQAHEVFDPSWKMLSANPDMKAFFDVNLTGSNDNPTGIHCRKNGGKYLPLIGNPGDGSSPSCSITDEYHEHITSGQLDTMITGQGSRRQPISAVITTAGLNTSGPCYTMRDDCINILAGVMKNEEMWCVIYTLDKGDKWEDFENWIKANPNIGVSVFEEFLRARHEEAMTKAERQNIVLCKHCNIWMNTGQAWINMSKFSLCGEDLSEDDFIGEECALSLDLATKIDICAYGKTFQRDGKYYVFLKYYLPEDTVQLIENAHYQQWTAEGLITVTPGARTDFDYVLEQIKADAEKFKIRGLGYDPWGSGYLVQQIEKEAPGIQCIEVSMSPKNLDEPMKELEACIYDRKFAYEEKDKALYWMTSNAMLRNDANKNYSLKKENAKSKIDGVMAVIIGIKVWMIEVEQSVASIYEQRGMRML